MNKYTVYTLDKVTHEGKTIENPKEIGLLIKKQIDHLGDVSIYWEPMLKQLKGWRKWVRLFGDGY